jgi:hypothetical protein
MNAGHENRVKQRFDEGFEYYGDRLLNPRWEQRMGQTTSAISRPRSISSGQLKGSARGALICAFFGSAWMYWAVVFSSNQILTKDKVPAN